ncbi:hypothetical protein GCM10023195_73110 [Actinoallomurus liliacearum]|uniref:Uncharacterized protein n=1 Tax=Actinoallomurus liliacearum TaxID=1080073 RepID=A0ABP8TU52_9ACTN
MVDRPPPDAIARLRRSVDRFYAALRSSPYGGVSCLADLAWLKVLIEKYPGEARRMVDDTNGESRDR